MTAWTPTHASLHQRLRTARLVSGRSRYLLPKGSHILMAVSGGQDSLCLAKLLLDLQPKWEWRLAIVHCDHRWRTDSTANAQHVWQLAQKWQLPCWIETAQTPPGNEAAARQWRYDVFETVAKQGEFSHLVTGHTLSDRAETLLYNLVRGSGADGLQALTWQRTLSATAPNIWVTRPILHLTREETAAFCQVFALPIWEDSTNQSLKFRRNRIRHELIPYLRKHFNLKTEQSLAQTVEILSAEVEYLEEQAAQLYDQVVTVDLQAGVCRCDRTLWCAAPLALQRRVARRLLQTVMPEPPLFGHIEKLVTLAHAPNRSQSDPFPGYWVARIEGPTLWLEKKVDLFFLSR
jgi:tRNA(Ile)-lysidine synthase